MVIQSEVMFTTGMVARRLGVSPEWVRVLIQTGRIVATKTPLGFLIAEPEIAAYEGTRAK